MVGHNTCVTIDRAMPGAVKVIVVFRARGFVKDSMK